MDVGGVRDDDSKRCRFHPGEEIVGVCAMCLNERLLVIAPKRCRRIHQTNKIYGISPKRALPKIFTTLRSTRRYSETHEEQQLRKPEVYGSSSTSPEDSFISIKFEENGTASWDKGKASNNIKMPLDDQTSLNKTVNQATQNKKTNTYVMEQTKQQGSESMSWRKRIGEILQLVKLNKRSSSKKELEGSKIRYGWIRNLMHTKGGRQKNEGLNELPLNCDELARKK